MQRRMDAHDLSDEEADRAECESSHLLPECGLTCPSPTQNTRLHRPPPIHRRVSPSFLFATPLIPPHSQARPSSTRSRASYRRSSMTCPTSRARYSSCRRIVRRLTNGPRAARCVPSHFPALARGLSPSPPVHRETPERPHPTTHPSPIPDHHHPRHPARRRLVTPDRRAGGQDPCRAGAGAGQGRARGRDGRRGVESQGLYPSPLRTP